MRPGLRCVAIAVIVTTVVVTAIGQGLAEPDPASGLSGPGDEGAQKGTSTSHATSRLEAAPIAIAP